MIDANAKGARLNLPPRCNYAVQRRILENTSASGIAQTYLLLLPYWADDAGVCYPSVSTLAYWLRCSVRSVQNIEHKLVAAGEIEIQVGASEHGTNIVRILCAQPGFRPAQRKVAPVKTRGAKPQLKIAPEIKQEILIQDSPIPDPVPILQHEIQETQKGSGNARAREVGDALLVLGEMQNVRLRPHEYEQLKTVMGADVAESYIRTLDFQIAAKHRVYPNHYATIQLWRNQDLNRRTASIERGNHEQRQQDDQYERWVESAIRDFESSNSSRKPQRRHREAVHEASR